MMEKDRIGGKAMGSALKATVDRDQDEPQSSPLVFPNKSLGWHQSIISGICLSVTLLLTLTTLVD